MHTVYLLMHGSFSSHFQMLTVWHVSMFIRQHIIGLSRLVVAPLCRYTSQIKKLLLLFWSNWICYLKASLFRFLRLKHRWWEATESQTKISTKWSPFTLWYWWVVHVFTLEIITFVLNVMNKNPKALGITCELSPTRDLKCTAPWPGCVRWGATLAVIAQTYNGNPW